MRVFKILIDTREQLPFFIDKVGDPDFPGLQIDFAALKTGDYSLENMNTPTCPHSICIERKSLDDLFGSTGKGRKRFEREFERMSEFDHAELVVENDLRAVFQTPPPMSQMVPKSVYRTIMAWSQRYGVPAWFCPSRTFAERHIYLSLRRFWLDRQPDGFMEFNKL